MKRERIMGKTKTYLAALATSFAIFGASSAIAQPDLIINEVDSRIYAGSCLTSEPLATGRIAIKNVGTQNAQLQVTETFRSMLAVWVPENIDMIAKITERSSLKPLDQEGLPFEVAKGVLKKGRFFLSVSQGELDNARRQVSNRNRTATIQTALAKIGFDPRGVDGVMGSNTRAAIRAYQGDKGDNRTGVLTDDQFQALVSSAGIKEFDNVTGANGITKVTLYAQVDPYNLIDESNEANNIRKFEVTIDCSN
ncbi:MAG: hypothetical protein DHS20C08_22370 [Rhodomicrobium sp.]|nr:MAG: hypothetical protein DHS20C08_22370 [Rhodomicrobium sp.]